MRWVQKVKDNLSRPVRGEVLGLFRIFFGMLMVYEIANYLRIDLVEKTFVLPSARLSYSFLEFLPELPPVAMQVLLGMLVIAAIGITVGFLFRISTLFFSFGYLYVFLLDKSLFNNHIYLFILLAFLLSFTHADKFLALTPGKSKGGNQMRIRYWEPFLIQAMLAIVYVYGGFAKLNYDWLVRMEPVRALAKGYPADGLMASFFRSGVSVPFLTYGGLLFDLCIPFLLWYKPTRKWALIPLILFHVMNSRIFQDIGIFPYVMMVSTVIFFPVNEIPLFRKRKKKGKASAALILEGKPWFRPVLLGFFAFQLLFPFRGFVLPNHQDWTMIANRFSWRMKIQTRDLKRYEILVTDGVSGTAYPVDITTILNTRQIHTTFSDPLALVSAAHGIGKLSADQGIRDPRVHAYIDLSWNGYPTATMLDPDADLLDVDTNPLHKLTWVWSPYPGK